MSPTPDPLITMASTARTRVAIGAPIGGDLKRSVGREAQLSEHRSRHGRIRTRRRQVHVGPLRDRQRALSGGIPASPELERVRQGHAEGEAVAWSAQTETYRRLDIESPREPRRQPQLQAVNVLPEQGRVAERGPAGEKTGYRRADRQGVVERERVSQSDIEPLFGFQTCHVGKIAAERVAVIRGREQNDRIEALHDREAAAHRVRGFAGREMPKDIRDQVGTSWTFGEKCPPHAKPDVAEFRSMVFRHPFAPAKTSLF